MEITYRIVGAVALFAVYGQLAWFRHGDGWRRMREPATVGQAALDWVAWMIVLGVVTQAISDGMLWLGMGATAVQVFAIAMGVAAATRTFYSAYDAYHILRPIADAEEAMEEVSVNEFFGSVEGG